MSEWVRESVSESVSEARAPRERGRESFKRELQERASSERETRE